MNHPGVEPSTKDLIGASAKTLFEVHGYAGTSVRAIAADAGIDPSLVIRHFGSKENLFLQVLGLGSYVRPPIDGPVSSLGERLAGFVLASEQRELRSHYAAMMRASDREAIREGLRDTVRRMFLDDLVEVLPGEDRMVRALLIGSLLGGIMQSGESLEAEAVPAIGRDRLVQMCGTSIQALVDLV